MTPTLLAFSSPLPGRIGIGVLWLAAAVAGVSDRPGASEPVREAPLRRVLEPVARGELVALATAVSGDVWWVTRDRVLRFRGGDRTRPETWLDAASHRRRFGDRLAAISAAHLDAEAGLWLGTRRGEVLRLRDGVWRRFPRARAAGAARPGGRRVAAITSDARSVYLAGEGLWRAPLDGGEWVALERFAGQRVARVAADPQQGLAVAVGSQVWRGSPGGEWRPLFRESHGGGAVRALAFAANGELWIGSSDGLLRVDARGVRRRELIGRSVSSLALGGTGVAFAGGSGLFARYAAGWRRVEASGDLDLREVAALASAPLGALWLSLGKGDLYRAGPGAGLLVAGASRGARLPAVSSAGPR